MDLTSQKYSEMADDASPASPIVKNCLCAFGTGGGICIIGQLLTDAFTAMQFSDKDAACLTSVSLVFLGALFTALGWYGRIAKFAGAGTLVPITGFSNAIASPAMEFKSEGYIAGVGAKMFIIAGPVIVYGTAASVFYGIFRLIAGVF